MWERWSAPVEVEASEPRDMFWNPLGQQNSPGHEREGKFCGGSLLENSTHVVGGTCQELCARTLLGPQPLCFRTPSP